VITLKICIVVPAYNEEKRIVRRLEDFKYTLLKKYGKDVIILIVSDGSTDRTDELIKLYSKVYPQIRLMRIKNSGKGGALLEGFIVACKKIKPDILGFVDADISYSGSEIIKLIDVLKEKDVDGVIGSRYLKDSILIGKDSKARFVASRGYNALVRILFGLNFADTQGGIKIFKGKALANILDHMHLSDMCFDINLLYELKLRNFRVLEIPVTCRVIKSGTTVDVKKQIPKMLMVTIGYKITRTPLTKVIPNSWKGYVYGNLKKW
jgi:dolichol-phosphate mannosyltransferase